MYMATAIAYIENSNIGSVKETINDIRRSMGTNGKDKKGKKKKSLTLEEATKEAVKHIENWGYPSLESFQDHFQKVINDLLSSIIPKLTLAVCKEVTEDQINDAPCGTQDGGEEKSPSNSPSHMIYKSELMFLVFLYVTSKSEDAENFMMKKYELVSDEYFIALRHGIEFLVGNHKLAITDDEIDEIFLLKFRLLKREIQHEAEHMLDVVEEISDMSFRDVKQNCDRCKETMEVACKAIMKIRMELFPRENEAENQ